MDVSFAFDLPPVPDCFNKLLINENDTSALPNQPWREAERLRELKDIMLKSLAHDSVPETSVVVNGDTEVSEMTLVDNQDGSSTKKKWEGSGESEDDRERTRIESKHSQVGTGSGSPVCRLNTALGRLKREMVSKTGNGESEK